MAWLHPIYLGLVAAALALATVALRGRWRLAAGTSAAVALLLSGALGVPWVSPRPAETREALGPGLVYERIVRARPRPIVGHVARVALDAPGLRLGVTPPTAPGPQTHPAMVTSVRLAASGGQLAINGSFFYPFESVAPWDYTPHAGEPVEVWGGGVSGGARFGADHEDADWLVLAPELRVVDDLPSPLPEEALTGQRLPRDEPAGAPPMPRTAVGIDRDAGQLILLVVDGRQPTYSEGLTMTELWELLVELGADEGIALDGGGSSTLVHRERGVLNRPIHTRMVGRERPVANHLVVFTD